MTINRHEPFEELISASLTGDLTDVERQRLDAHLDACAACRSVLAAFMDQRRIMSGLRHVAPPRDLAARVRTGVERGTFATLPWWRRPAVMFAGIGGSLAAITGVLLALVLLNGTPDEPEIGDATPSASVSPTATASAAVVPSPSQEPLKTLPPILPPASPDASPAESITPPSPSTQPSPTATPIPPSPEPDVFIALTGPSDNLALMVHEPVPSGEPLRPIAQLEVFEAPNTPPIAAELSPDGQWLAYIAELGLSGLNEVRVARVADPPGGASGQMDVGEVVLLGRSLATTPFLKGLEWSPDSGRLAYTLADPDASGATDVWIYEPEATEPERLTDVGNAYAASWIPDPDDDGAASGLWVSLAAAEPVSYVLELAPDDEVATVDPGEDAIAEATDVFMPTLTADGLIAIYWTGSMDAEDGLGWVMSEGGEPYLAEHDLEDGTFRNERPLFSDLDVGDEGWFRYAGISWSSDGDAYAIWDAAWTGPSQGGDDLQYPDPRRVYFGHATDPRGLTRDHAIDEADLPTDTTVVDAKASPTGEHLLVTVRYPLPGDLSPPRADLLLIERNTGNEADVVRNLSINDEGWFGPAAFDGDDED